MCQGGGPSPLRRASARWLPRRDLPVAPGRASVPLRRVYARLPRSLGIVQSPAPAPLSAFDMPMLGRWPQSKWALPAAGFALTYCFSALAPPVKAAATAKIADPCSSDMDCQLNGACTAGACVCDKGWRSADCGTLNLNSTASVAYGYTPESKFSSWGGGPPMWDSATGKYQLLA